VAYLNVDIAVQGSSNIFSLATFFLVRDPHYNFALRVHAIIQKFHG